MPLETGSILPQELYDTILDHLASDLPSLKCCGIVCKAFVPRTRHHLFDHTTLTRSNTSIPDFVECIAPYVQKLTVEDSNVPDHLLLHSFSRVTGLHLNHLWIKNPNARSLLNELMLPRILTLSLTDVHFESMPHMIVFIASFRRLEALFISRVSWEQPSDGSDAALPLLPVAAPSTLRRLEFRATSSPGTLPMLLDWVGQSSQSDTDAVFESLDVEWIDDVRDVAAVGRFLASPRGQHILDLSLSLHPYGCQDLTTSDLVQHWLSPAAPVIPLTALAQFRLNDLVIGSPAEATNVCNDFLPLALRRIREMAQSHSTPSPYTSSFSHAPSHSAIDYLPRSQSNERADHHTSLEISLQVRIAGLHQLGRLESVEFDWAQLQTGLEGEGVKTRVLLSCDEEDDLTLTTKQRPEGPEGDTIRTDSRSQWRSGVEGYFVAQLGEKAMKNVVLVWDVDDSE